MSNELKVELFSSPLAEGGTYYWYKPFLYELQLSDGAAITYVFEAQRRGPDEEGNKAVFTPTGLAVTPTMVVIGENKGWTVVHLPSSVSITPPHQSASGFELVTMKQACYVAEHLADLDVDWNLDLEQLRELLSQEENKKRMLGIFNESAYR
jgi:hypothetical protein